MGYDHIPGHAAWKFVTKDKIIYRQSNVHAMKFYWDNRDWHSFRIYVRTPRGWEFVHNHVRTDKCQCGRFYDDNSSGQVFKFQEPPLVHNIKAMSITMRSPILCQICYYKGELKAGRWAPQYVKRQLRLES